MARVFLLDLVRQGPLSPMGYVRQAALAVFRQQGMKAVQLFVDCRLVQGAVKNVDRLVPTTHATSLWSWVTRCGGRHRVGDYVSDKAKRRANAWEGVYCRSCSLSRWRSSLRHCRCGPSPTRTAKWITIRFRSPTSPV